MLEIINEGILSRVPERGAYMPSITELGEGARLSLWGSRSSPWPRAAGSVVVVEDHASGPDRHFATEALAAFDPPAPGIDKAEAPAIEA